jgi:hypothetical protein
VVRVQRQSVADPCERHYGTGAGGHLIGVGAAVDDVVAVMA